MTYTWANKIITSPSVRKWSYRSSLAFFLIFFVGFCAVIPIDSISQASQSTKNYALNTFVVVGALVLFGVVATFISLTRLFILRSALSDIPKRYIPLDDGDLPTECLKMINENFERCEKIRQIAPLEEVNHPALSPPNSQEIPPLLCYEDVIRAVGMKFKWEHNLMVSDFKLPKNLSFRELIAYLETKMISTDKIVNRQYVELYEKFRYSGDLITEEEFIEFMELSIKFTKNTNINFENEKMKKYSNSEFSKNSTIDFRNLRNRSIATESFLIPEVHDIYESPKTSYEDSIRQTFTNDGSQSNNQLYRITTTNSVDTTGTTRYNY